MTEVKATKTVSLTLARGGKKPWVAWIRGPDAQYGFQRDFVEGVECFVAGKACLRYDVSTWGFYESCQTTAEGVEVRLYYDVWFVHDELVLRYATPTEVFDGVSTEHNVFGWPRWFDRLFSPKQTVEMTVKHKAGVGEMLATKTRPDCLFLVMWVATFNVKTGESVVTVCPVQRVSTDSPPLMQFTTVDLDRGGFSVRGSVGLPRGDWDSNCPF